MKRTGPGAAAAQASDDDEFMDREFLQGPDLSRQDFIGRPPAANMNPRTELIEFMQTDCDYYTERPQGQYREEGEKEDTGKPVIRLFGVNAAGNSVCAHVHNFTAYFYIHIIEQNVTLSTEEIEQFRV